MSTHQATSTKAGRIPPKTVEIRIRRREKPDAPQYWETFEVPYKANLNIISCLMEIQKNPVTKDGQKTTPPVWNMNCLEQVCGACTMVINGRVRQSCSALVDRLLEDRPGEIELTPMTKFPVVRDLVVDRSRLFRALSKVKAWIPADGYYDQGPGARISQEAQESMYPLSECMSCGCCLDACPQYLKIE